MWNRNQGGATGSNNTPLGSRRRFGGDQDDAGPGAAPRADKRGRSPTRPDGPRDGPRMKRRKRNRWGDVFENKAAGLMGLETSLSGELSQEQLEAYTLHLRIEEISQKLRINDVVPSEGDRSPSPPPQYDNFGRRVNTRELRYRKRLEDERHKLVEKAMKTIPNYNPPQDYRRPTKTQEKIYVPVNDYPEINFIGLLIGPRGNTLKNMEKDSGAKIAIRGKGSVKEGKGRSDAAHTSNQEEELHCLIMADTEEKVNKAKSLINKIIETAASTPEAQNELKRNQLRELAQLNGTLRDDENQACQNCGEIGHRKYDCPNRQNYTANIICRICGNAGHFARDCTERKPGQDFRNAPRGRSNADTEYEKLMLELGGGGATTSNAAPQFIEAAPGGYDNNAGANDSNDSLPPWQRAAPAATSSLPPWMRPSNDSPAPSSAPPWAAGSYTGGENYGYAQQTSYSTAPGAPPGGLPPWQQQQQQSAPGTQPSYNYAAYPGYDYSAMYGQATATQAPPWAQSYQSAAPGSVPPPPPPMDDAPPPPPPSDVPPPPPPGA